MRPELVHADKLIFVYAVNRAFLPFALVSMQSVLETQNGECAFHIVHDGDLDSSLQQEVHRHLNAQGAELSFHSVPDSFPRQFAPHWNWDVSVMYRLALTEILPADMGRVIYLDADTLVRRPLAEMASLDLGEHGLAAVPEDHDAIERLNLPSDSAYLNSGVLVIDLETWRRNQTSQQLLSLMMQQPERWVFADQCVLATHFAGQWERLSPEYNITHRFTNDDAALPLPADEPFIIHFTGQGNKPWESQREHPYADEFWQVASAVRAAGFDVPDRPIKKRRWYQRGPIAAYRAYRKFRNQFKRQQRETAHTERRAHLQQRETELIARHVPELVVRRGPFAGMRYPQAYSHGSTLLPKLMGTYEAELDNTFEAFLGRDYPVVIDVGGAEGYYAVGAAMRWPNARVIAYELQREARAAIDEMASTNGVSDRLEIQAECMFADLYGQRALVIVDIEGCEAELLLRAKAKEGFADSDFLIETHDLFRPGVCQKLHDQFAATHDVKVIDAILDDERPLFWALPELGNLPFEQQSEIIGERRGGPMQWLVCESRNRFPQRQIPQRQINGVRKVA